MSASTAGAVDAGTLEPSPAVATVATPVSYKLDREGVIDSVSFLFAHVATVGLAIYVGASLTAVLACLATYLVRMFFITGGYHRYFAHRAYKTSRAFQFVLAFGGVLAAQKGPLWWAAHHREHHRWSDTPQDVHSPVQAGFFWSHIGWIISSRYKETRFDKIRDFACYPELRWLDKNPYYAPLGALVLLLVLAGPQIAVWAGLVSTVLLWHGTFTINSLAHVWGSRRYPTPDQSRNNLFLALITGGEGWHNNHHYYQSAANQGFFWYEIDVSYRVLRVLSWFGIVWDLRTPPAVVLEAGRQPAAVAAP